MSDNEPTECARCRKSIVIPYGKWDDFCSEACEKQGRARCKFCRRDIEQPEKGRRLDFCRGTICAARFAYMGAELDPKALEDWDRSTCKGCGKPITQPKMGVREFCDNPKCRLDYNKRLKSGENILEDWSNCTPGMRVVLRHVQHQHGLGLANWIATTIHSDYVPRKQSDNDSLYITYICKCGCGTKFRRRKRSFASKDYCKFSHNPLRKPTTRGAKRKLTKQQVRKIQKLYSTQHLTQQTLAEKYGVSDSTISKVITNQYFI